MVQSRLWGAGSGVILRVANMVVMGGNALIGGRTMRRVYSPHYSIYESRLLEIAEAAHISEDEAFDFVLADWPEGREHQDWIDNEDTEVIAAWVRRGRA